jgi:HK97 family phage major capsid protein
MITKSFQETMKPVLEMTDKRYVGVEDFEELQKEHNELTKQYDGVLREIAELKTAPAFVSQETRERGNTKPELSIARLCTAYVQKRTRGDYPAGKIYQKEVEYLREDLDKTLGNQKAFASGTTTSGGFLIPEVWQDSVITELAAKAVVLGAGPQIIPCPGKKMHLPAFGADATAQWLPEAGSSTESTPATSEVTLTLNTARISSAYSIEWMNYSSPAIDAAFQANLVRSLKRFVDAAFLTGSGSNRPTGLRTVSSPTLVGAQNNNANGGNLAYGDLVNLLDGLDGANVDELGRTFFMNPRSFTRIRALVDSQNRPLLYDFATPLVNGDPKTLFGYPYYKSTQISKTETKGTGTNLSPILLVNMNDIYVGVGVGDLGIRIDISEHALFSNAQVAIRLLFQCDIQPGHSASVGILEGVA